MSRLSLFATGCFNKIYTLNYNNMINLRIALRGSFFTGALFSLVQISAQNTECKVLIPEISGTYTGECKNGLAHGKGTATGKDRYEGQFNKGLPHGKGTYSWSTGVIYNGEWSKGMREGEGQMIYFTAKGDSIVNGFWKRNSYVGEKDIPAYVVVRKDDLLGCNFRKIGSDDIIILRFMLKGQINTRLSNLQMTSSSGTRFKSGSYEGLQSVRYPLDLKITYTTSNPISRSSFDVVFECTINEAGKWEITLNN